MELETTDPEIATMILQQTYADRMDMANWLTSALNDYLSDQVPDYKLTDDDLAKFLGSWAESVMDRED